MSIWEFLGNIFSRFSILDLVDIALVTVLIYYILKLASRTRAMQVLKGCGIMLIAARISEWIGLQSITWVLNYVINMGAVLIIVLFQPELRKAFEHIGRTSQFRDSRRSVNEEDLINQMVVSLTSLSKSRTGALIALERQVALDDIAETGTGIGAEVSNALLGTIFMPGTPLHDGAVIIQDGYIKAAGCFLPLTNSDELPKTLGTRHRAAVGLSEVSDSVVFVVSEETGTISCAMEGRLTTNLDAGGIRAIMESTQGKLTGWSLTDFFRRSKAQ